MIMATRKAKVPEEDLKSLLDHDDIEEVTEFIPTGCLLLDYGIANHKNGGIPVGRITELIGENQAGKTLIATHVIAETQKRGGIAVCIDTEHDMDKQFSTRVGARWDELIYKEYLQCLEEVFEYIEKVIVTTRQKHKDKLILIVWDSIAATPAKIELEAGFDPTSIVGLHARIMSKGLRKIRMAIKSERIALLCTNQTRAKIGGVSWADNTTTAHGKAMSFYASVRVKLSRTKMIKSGKRATGAMCEAKIIKNKCGPAWRVVTFPLMYDWGIDNATSMFDVLCDLGLAKSGPWCKMKIPGREEMTFRKDDWPKLFYKDKELREYVLAAIDADMVVIPKANPALLQNIDTDSILEVEQIQANVMEREHC